MNLEQVWNELDKQEPAADLLLTEQIAAARCGESHGVLRLLRRKMWVKTGLNLGIGVATLAAIFFYTDRWEVMMILGLLSFFCLSLGTVMVGYARRLSKDIPAGLALLPFLRQYRDTARQALRFEENYGSLFIIPAPAVGALYAWLEESMTLEEIFAKPFLIGVLVAVMAVFGPLGIWATKKMNQIAYGRYLRQLDENIRDLEEG
ncbi:MAG: hypothetical protein OHK0039_33510 [Bacteroidia bacterium]